MISAVAEVARASMAGVGKAGISIRPPRNRVAVERPVATRRPILARLQAPALAERAAAMPKGRMQMRMRAQVVAAEAATRTVVAGAAADRTRISWEEPVACQMQPQEEEEEQDMRVPVERAGSQAAVPVEPVEEPDSPAAGAMARSVQNRALLAVAAAAITERPTLRVSISAQGVEQVAA